ncbi:UNVERIFIED_CONTAM: hypothetical protein PYX00_011615 [Menopon gallinae]|uniref:SAM-dependent MTase RsmB/NOP-type domain-containing protein n=1 Tax=Menopon gallinae TaxID=328185 RepID=A0AAW2H812_9NEOP
MDMLIALCLVSHLVLAIPSDRINIAGVSRPLLIVELYRRAYLLKYGVELNPMHDEVNESVAKEYVGKLLGSIKDVTMNICVPHAQKGNVLRAKKYDAVYGHGTAASVVSIVREKTRARTPKRRALGCCPFMKCDRSRALLACFGICATLTVYGTTSALCSLADAGAALEDLCSFTGNTENAVQNITMGANTITDIIGATDASNDIIGAADASNDIIITNPVTQDICQYKFEMIDYVVNRNIEAAGTVDAAAAGKSAEDAGAAIAQVTKDVGIALAGTFGIRPECPHARPAPAQSGSFPFLRCSSPCAMSLDSYNEFLREKIEQMFNREEAAAYAAESDKPRPTVIRVNTLLKHPKELATLLGARGVELESLAWCDHAFVAYGARVPIGATPEYLAGYYAIQGASSLLPVLALDVRPGQTVLDMCAAPGGKAAFIGTLLRNTGTLFCVDVSKERAKALRGNLQRQGIAAITICEDARKVVLQKMDRVLLDAPCLGTGIVSRDQSVKVTKDEKELRRTACLQKELLLKAWNMLKEGGVLVYSTCSILVEENEEVVEYLCGKVSNVKILEGPPIGKKGFVSYRGKFFNKDMANCRRLYPHVYNMDGFFVAKMTKTRPR